MYPVVLSFIPFSCWRAFPKVGKARIFYGPRLWASGQKKTPGRSRGRGKSWGFT